MRLSLAALLPLLAVFLSACQDDSITRVRVPKTETDISAVALAPSARPKGLVWTLPPGWKESRGTGMRLATFTPPGGLKTEATVVAIPGGSGGELANVNRWRGQIGLPATDDAGMAASRTTLATKAGPAAVYDLTSAGEKRTRLIAAAVETGGTTWFFKLMGDAAATESARPAFLGLVKGVQAKR
jgi:hypothetical protein